MSTDLEDQTQDRRDFIRNTRSDNTATKPQQADNLPVEPANSYLFGSMVELLNPSSVLPDLSLKVFPDCVNIALEPLSVGVHVLVKTGKLLLKK